MSDPAGVPAEVGTDQPSVARVYDYLLGGDHNFEVDREFARQLQAAAPAAREGARANRHFLRRVVQHLVSVGVDQFLDIGSGIPTVGNVHEIAQDDNPRARVVYIDNDPFAVAYSREILTGNLNASALQGDLRDIDTLLADPELHRQLDLTRPVAVLLLAILHFVPDADDPAAITARLAAALPSGSYLAISHVTVDGIPADVRETQRLAARLRADLTPRTHAQVTALFNGFPLTDSGLVYLPYWQPDDPDEIDDRPELKTAYAGLGCKP